MEKVIFLFHVLINNHFFLSTEYAVKFQFQNTLHLSFRISICFLVYDCDQSENNHLNLS